jgi:quercetin dioxygenase-like cupin family protein
LASDAASLLSPQISRQFAESGYIGPLRVLSKRECQRFLRALDFRPRLPLDWEKGGAATSRSFYELGTAPSIVGVVSELLQGDAVLWGVSIQTRVPGQVHPWHSDIETSSPDCRTVAVWIGLEHTTPKSSLLAIAGSHHFGTTVQEVRHLNGKSREEAGIDDLVRWAQERDERSELVALGAHDGDALFFDGRLWHGTHNVSRRTRRAVLLQYAAPETSIEIPDLNYLDWPFRQVPSPRPPCLIVSGSALTGRNRIVPAPDAPGGARDGVRLSSRIHPLRLPLPESPEPWKPFPAFAGSTADMPAIACHASVLQSGHSPHPPHAHAEEEILILLAGQVQLELADGATAQLYPGELVYYPAGFAHTLRTTSAEPATYVMFKWRGATVGSPVSSLSFERFGTAEAGVLFEGPTRYLRKLHSHVTVLEPGAGYEPHADAYDVAIVVLEGEVETIGGRAAAHDVIFYRAGEQHGMRNVGDIRARYVVFEFHGRSTLASEAPGPVRALLEELVNPRHWKRRAKKLLRR